MDTARSAGGQHAGDVRDVKKVAFASFIGTTIEWYDFFLYGTAAALVFGELFFPDADPLVGTLAAFGTFAVGFVARPLGGVVFGHFGDRVGRKAMLVTALLIMGARHVPDRPAADVRRGRRPGAGPAGRAALHAGHRRRRRVGRRGADGRGARAATAGAASSASWPQMGVPVGLLLSTAVFAAVRGLTPEDDFLAWGWRVPFLLSAVLIGVGLFIR